MPKIPPLLKPFLRLLELAAVVFIIFKIVDYSVEAEQAAMAQYPNWREQIGIGLAQTFLGAIVFFIYFLFWHFRIIAAVRKEKQRGAKYLNIGLLSLFPGIFLAGLLYWQFQKEIVKHEAKAFLTPVSYHEIFRTPDTLTKILGFRPTSDSLLILTYKLKPVHPQPTVYRDGKKVPVTPLQLEPKENSEKLFSLKNKQLKQIGTQHHYLQFRKYHFRDTTICLWPNSNPQNQEEVYRFDNCKKQPLLKPALIGYSPEFYGSTRKYEVGHNLFFLTSPLYSDFRTNPYFYIARIDNSKAIVYLLDLEKNEDLVKEFKTYPYVRFFATTHKIYLVSGSRILEINI